MLLSLFRATSQSNVSHYTIEMFLAVCQQEALMPPELAYRARHSQFFNWNKRRHENIESDKAMENVIRITNDCIRGLGANKTPYMMQLTNKAATGEE